MVLKYCHQSCWANYSEFCCTLISLSAGGSIPMGQGLWGTQLIPFAPKAEVNTFKGTIVMKSL